MDIMQYIKLLVGYQGNDLDHIFAIVSIFVLYMFIQTTFNIFTNIFTGGRKFR